MPKSSTMITKKPEVIRKSVKVGMIETSWNQIEAYCQTESISPEDFISQAAELTISQEEYQKAISGHVKDAK